MSLPSKDEIMGAIAADDKVAVGRQLLWKALQVGMASEENITAVSSLLSDLLFRGAEDQPQLEKHVVDAFWLVGSTIPEEETKKEPEKKEAKEGDEEVLPDAAKNGNTGLTSRDALVKILQSLLEKPEEEEQSVMTKKKAFMVQLQSCLDPSILEKANLVNSEKDLMKKLRMLNTKSYRQHKFNLLQEESEGFSKVLEALVKRDYSALKVIIGTFHVDPNRILDLALDVMIEENSQNTTATSSLDWLKEFSIEKIPALIAFKLKNSAESPAHTQKILQTIAALAIQDPDILPLDKMSNYLEPISPLLTKTFPLYTQIERKRVRSVGRVRLGGSSASQKKEEERDAQAQAKLMSQIKELEQMHRIQLISLLLQERQWKLVQVMFPKADELKQIITLFQPLGSAVCEWIQEELAPLCEKYCMSPPNMTSASAATKPAAMEVESLEETTVEQVVEMISKPLLCILDSGCITSQTTLYFQLCRLVRALLIREHGSKEGSISPSSTLYTFIQSFLLPSLSLFPANPSLSMEVWSILQLFHYTTRYQLYRDWRGVGLEKAGLQLFGEKKKPLVLVESEMHAGKDARYVLKRLSKDTIRESCRHIAKVTHSNPLVMFTTVLNQIESYDNLVSVMVEALRFVSPLGLDVLGFCMLSRLCGSTNNEGDRSRSKEGGINVALWLQSLESFVGVFYERCPFVEFRGIVCYVMRRLRGGHVTELGVLRNLLKTTGGWSFEDYSPAASLSATQLEGRAGTTLLKRETMTFGVVDKFNLRSSRQLRSVLQSEDMGVSLLILLAQVRSRIVFDGKGGRPKPVKLIGSLFDTTQVVMATLLDFITKSSDLAQPFSGSSKGKVENGETKKTSAQNERNEIVHFAGCLPTLADLVKTYGIDMATAWMLCRPLVRAAEKEGTAGIERPLKPFSMTDTTRDAYKALVHPETAWDDISPEFFEIFYLHTLYDLMCPENIYNAEVNRVSKEVERLTQRQQQGGTHSLQPGSVGGGPQQNPEEEIERLKKVSSELSSQVPAQKKRVEMIHKKLKDSAETFFPRTDVSVSAVNTFLTHCVFPRSMQGPDDAMYCAQFVTLLHKGETPGFSTLHYLDELVSVLSSSLFGVTEGEAANLSILFLETWKLVARWRYDEKAYEEEVVGKPGSFMVDPVEEGGTTSEGNIFPVSFEQYKALFVKWHTSFGAAALGCLKSSEYIHTRASLIVLSRIVNVFPSRPNLGNKLFEVLEPMKAEGNLPDIRSAAQAYIMQLTKARTDGVWKEEDAAVVQARLKAEKEAQEQRRKKAAERFDDMKKDVENINTMVDEDRGGRGRDGRDVRDSRDRTGRGRPSDRDGRHSPAPAGVLNFEPPPRRAADSGAPRGGDRDHGRGRDGGDRRRETDARPAPSSTARTESASRSSAGGRVGGRDDDRGGLGSRWDGSSSRNAAGGRRGKRGRSPSPDDRGRGDHHQSSKRSRTDLADSHRSPDHRGGGGGGRRRDRR